MLVGGLGQARTINSSDCSHRRSVSQVEAMSICVVAIIADKVRKMLLF